MKKLLFFIAIVFFFSCEKEKEVVIAPQEPDTFCWICEMDLYKKVVRCGTLQSNVKHLLGYDTKCDMSVLDIRAYETSLGSVTTTEEYIEECSGHSWYPYQVTTNEIRVTCTVKQ